MTNVLRSRATTRDVRIRASILTNGKRGARNGSHCWASCRRGPLAHGHPITRNGIALTTFSLAPSSLPSCRFCPSARCPNTIYITPTLPLRPATHFLFSIYPSHFARLFTAPFPACRVIRRLRRLGKAPWLPSSFHFPLPGLYGVADMPTGSFGGFSLPVLSHSPLTLNSWYTALGDVLLCRRARVCHFHLEMRLLELWRW